MPATLTTNQIMLPMPHQGQRRVEVEMRRFNVLCCGRRWRKTTFGMAHGVRQALKGQQIVWGAPTYKQCDVAWAEFKKAVGHCFNFHAGKMEITAPSGGKLFLRSMDNPDNARGLSAHGILMDETADCIEEAWTEVLRPMLIDTQGWALFKGTPKGRNWFYHLFNAALARNDGMAWQIPSLGCELINGKLIRKPHPYENPDIPFAELENMLYGDGAIPERVFRQEILAEFIEDAGGVFSNIDRCVRGLLPPNPCPPDRNRRYVMGVDLAKYNDFTVVVVMDELTKTVVDFHRFNKIDWHVQKQRIYLIAEFWNNALAYVDSTGVGDPIWEDLRRSGMRVEGYKILPTSKADLINNLITLIEQQQISFPKIAVLVDELKAYEYERLPAGGLRMNAPSGQHDDCVIALALACWPLGHQSPAMRMDWLDELTLSAKGQKNFGGNSLLSKKF